MEYKSAMYIYTGMAALRRRGVHVGSKEDVQQAGTWQHSDNGPQ